MTDKLWSDLEALKIERKEPEASTGARSARRYLVYGAGVVIGLVAGLIVYLALGSTPRDTAVSVGVIAMMGGSTTESSFSCSGYVEATRTARVDARIAERVIELGRDEGDFVEKGDLLARLDDVEQNARIAAATADLRSSESRAAVVQAELLDVLAQARRARALGDKGVVAQAQGDDLEARAKVFRARLEAAEAETRSARAGLVSLQIGLEHTRILAPISGVIVERAASVGETVSPVSDALFEIADFSSLIVRTDVPEDILHRIKIGGACRIYLDAHPDRTFACATARIRSRVNRAKATAVVEARFSETVDGVLPGMAARVDFLPTSDFEQKESSSRRVVPTAAVVRRAGRDVVFTVGADGTAKEVVVEIGKPISGGFELIAGPPKDTRVILQPPEGLKEGTKVQIASR